MSKFIVAGCGTEVGKTVVAAILTTLLEGEYWKPIQSGPACDSDTAVVARLLDTTKHRIHPPAYSLEAPVSPHHAARLEGRTIDVAAISLPQTSKNLVIESVGGIFVPLTPTVLSIDLFSQWACRWIVVSKHYLGSINHTLLTIEALKRKRVNIAGIVFNGEVNVDSECAILHFSALPCLGRVLPERELNLKIIQRYAQQWQRNLFLL